MDLPFVKRLKIIQFSILKTKLLFIEKSVNTIMLFNWCELIKFIQEI